jgi:hypothetical protein
MKAREVLSLLSKTEGFSDVHMALQDASNDGVDLNDQAKLVAYLKREYTQEAKYISGLDDEDFSKLIDSFTMSESNSLEYGDTVIIKVGSIEVPPPSKSKSFSVQNSISAMKKLKDLEGKKGTVSRVGATVDVSYDDIGTISIKKELLVKV